MKRLECVTDAMDLENYIQDVDPSSRAPPRSAWCTARRLDQYSSQKRGWPQEASYAEGRLTGNWSFDTGGWHALSHNDRVERTMTEQPEHQHM